MRLGVLTDLHWSTDPQETGAWHNPYQFAGVPSRVDAALEWFQGRVDAIAILGDVAHRGDVGSLSAALAAFALQTCPVFVVCGNHDITDSRGQFASALTSVRSEEIRLATPRGELRDGIRLAGMQIGAAEGWFGARLGDTPQFDSWESEPVVLLTHYPLLSRAQLFARNGWPYPGDLFDRGHIETRLLHRTAPTIVLSGHIHARDVHINGPILQLAQGAVVEPPFDAAIIELTTSEGQLRVARRTHRLPGEPAIREPVLTSNDGAWRFDLDGWASASTPA